VVEREAGRHLGARGARRGVAFSLSDAAIASASASTSSGGTSAPACVPPSTSGTAPTLVETTGTSARIASSSTLGSPSLRDGITSRSRRR
jgi:hypothetical protein